MQAGKPEHQVLEPREVMRGKHVMYKPLFFTAVMSVVACFAQAPASAETKAPQTRAAKPCADGKMWDRITRKCVDHTNRSY